MGYQVIPGDIRDIRGYQGIQWNKGEYQGIPVALSLQRSFMHLGDIRRYQGISGDIGDTRGYRKYKGIIRGIRGY